MTVCDECGINLQVSEGVHIPGCSQVDLSVAEMQVLFEEYREKNAEMLENTDTRISAGVNVLQTAILDRCEKVAKTTIASLGVPAFFTAGVEEDLMAGARIGVGQTISVLFEQGLIDEAKIAEFLRSVSPEIE